MIMSFIKHKVQFDFRPKGRQSGKFVGRNECLLAGKFAVTGIGNADVPIRSRDDRPAVRVQGDSRVSETTGLQLNSSILCWNFAMAEFTIQQSDNHFIVYSRFSGPC